MAIVTFWSNGKEETAKTLSVAAIATNMAIEHNYKVLVLSTTYNDDTLECCYWPKVKKNNTLAELVPPGSVVEIDNGIAGLAKTLKTSKASPELIANYTKVVFKDRLDVLLAVKSGSYDEYDRLKELYPEIIQAANEYYDIVIVDASKGSDKPFVKEILKISDLIVSTITQRIKIIDEFIELRKKEKIFSTNKNMILIGRYDKYSKYSAKNIARYMNIKEDIKTVPYSTLFFEACNEGKVADFFLRFKTLTMDENDRNLVFIKEVQKATEDIDYKLQELRLKM